MKLSLVITFVTLFLIPNESSAAPQSGSFSGRAVKFVSFVLYTNYLDILNQLVQSTYITIIFISKDKKLGETCGSCFSIGVDAKTCGTCASGLGCYPQKEFGIIVTDKPWKCIKENVPDLTGM